MYSHQNYFACAAAVTVISS